MGDQGGGQGGALVITAFEALNETTSDLQGKIGKLEGEIGKLQGEIDKLGREIEAARASGEKELELAMRMQTAGMHQRLAELQREKNILLERSGPAGQEAFLPGQLADFQKAQAEQNELLKKELSAEVKNTLSAMLASKTQQSQSFSSVNGSDAESVLRELHIMEVDGHALEPIDMSGGVECTGFDLSQYPGEEAGTPDLMRHHQEQLSRCGLPFGLDGYAMYDVQRERSCLQFKSESKNRIFKGSTDCTLAPFGLLGASRATCMRVAFEHKKPSKQAADVGAEPQPVSYSRHKGQSIAIALGALACASWPMFVDLTDGEVHHLLALRGERLLVWRALTPAQAYNKIAQDLRADPHLASIEAKLDEVVDEEDEGVRQLKRIRSTIQVTSVLREQLDSLLPFLSGPEKYRAAFEIIASHVSAAGSQDDGDDEWEENFLHMFA